MAITYHAGRRLQGVTSDTGVTVSGFSGTWDKDPSNSQFEVSGGKLNFLENANAGGDRTWIDLGTNVSETEWVLRVRLRFTTIATQSAYPEIDFGISDNHANSDTDQDFIGCRILPMAANNLFRPRKCIAEKPRRGSAANPNPSPAFTTGKDYYFEFKRTSATNWSASMSNTNAYDGDIYSGSFATASTSLNGLRYFTVMDSTTATSGDMEGYIDVFEFYNGITTLPPYPPTNVQVGSRFEETDTRKMYHYESNITVDDDLTTDKGWVSDTSDWTYNATGDYIDFAYVRRQLTSQKIYIDMQDADYLGSGNNLSDTKWVTRFKVRSGAESSTGNVMLYIGFSNNLGDSGATQQTACFQFNFSPTENMMACAVSRNNFETTGTPDRVNSNVYTSGNLPFSTDFYIQMVRDGDTFTMKAYSDEYVTQVGVTATATVTGISALRYIKGFIDSEQAQSYYSTGSRLYDMKIYNGVTSLGNVWSEEGT